MRIDAREDQAADELLRSTHGFLVDRVDGTQLGVVDDIRLDGESAQVFAIDVSGGWFGRRRFSIGVADVVEIWPGQRRLVVEVPTTDRTPANRERTRSPKS